MRLVFRADASPRIGSGHVMRTSAIAEEAISRGIECVFVGSIQNLDWVAKRIENLGFSQIILPQNFQNHPVSDVLILDSYTLDICDSFVQPNRWDKIISIADFCTPNYPSNLIIHPGIDGSWFKGEPKNFLFGARYVPMRKEIERTTHIVEGLADNVVIFGGGADHFNFALAVASKLVHISGFGKAIFVSDDHQTIEVMDSRFQVVPFGKSIDKMINAADLVFTTASTSSLEIIARGLPLGIACAVKNQTKHYQNLVELGLASPLGQRTSSGLWELNTKEMEMLIGNPLYRFGLKGVNSIKVDLLGSKRVVDAILKLLQ
jgi:spore coat polysaccharide biosynthesis predicted glycosyltransferase SpsG